MPKPGFSASRIALPWLTVVMLAACGGDGSDTGTKPPAGVANPVAPSAGRCGDAAFVLPALALINARRAAGASCGGKVFAPSGALRWNDALNAAAQGHSQDMAGQNYFSHTSKDGRSMADRINAAGYAWNALGENIAAGNQEVAAVIDGWMRSEGHCSNIMNPAMVDVGLACAPAGPNGADYGYYWTMDLGRPAGG